MGSCFKSSIGKKEIGEKIICVIIRKLLVFFESVILEYGGRLYVKVKEGRS